MAQILLMGLPLVAGLGLALLAGRRDWAPSPAVALGVGAGLRLVIMLLAAGAAPQPYDLAVDFPAAADAVRHGHDPVFAIAGGRWHFLTLMAYVLAGQQEVGRLLGLPWSVAGRIVPILADLALIPLVGRLATERRQLRAFQYACAPLGVMISAIHGQFPPLSLLFGVAALLVARAGRPHAAGVLLGLTLTSTSWTALLVPGVLLTAPAARRLTVLGWTAAIPAAFLLSSSVFLDTPLPRLPAAAAGALSARPVAGDWGWSAIATGGHEVVSATFSDIGTPLLAIGLLAAGWRWRRAGPVDLTIVLLVAFLIFSYRFGTQYLLWPMPYLIARPTRRTWPAITAAGIWAAAAYLHAIGFLHDGHEWWALSSLAVIAFLIRAVPPTHPAATGAVPDGQERQPERVGWTGSPPR